MAYLHCHTKGCGWSQDDFYTRSYNPATKLLSAIKWTIRPRWMTLDLWVLNDIPKYAGVPVYIRNVQAVHSWNWMLVEMFKVVRIARQMEWWTWKSWKRNRDTAVCPKCGERNFDID